MTNELFSTELLMTELRITAKYLDRQRRSTHAGNNRRRFSKERLRTDAERFKGAMDLVAKIVGGLPTDSRTVTLPDHGGTREVDMYNVYLEAIRRADGKD